MKRKILVPMFASLMAFSMNVVSAHADNIENKKVDEKNTDKIVDLDEYKESTYKTAVVKDGVAVKIRENGDVQTIAYTGDKFKVIATQGEWVRVALEDGEEGWLPARYVDITESTGYITGEKVNLRKKDNTDSDIIEELEVGSTVKVLEANEDWMKVKKGEKEGYVRAFYISEEAPVIELENITVSTPSSTTTNTTTNTNASNSNSSVQAQKPATKPSQQNNNSYNPPASSTSKVQAVLNLAYSKQGCPYVWGAEGPNTFDCSGFTSYVFRNAAGVNLPRTSSAQSGYGKTVSKSNLQPGDLVFFNTSGSGVSHVGIYVGGGSMIHAPSSGKTVSVTSINSSYYSARFVTAKRVL